MNYKQRDSLSFQKLEGTEHEMIISSKGNTNTQSSTDRKLLLKSILMLSLLLQKCYKNKQMYPNKVLVKPALSDVVGMSVNWHTLSKSNLKYTLGNF